MASQRDRGSNRVADCASGATLTLTARIAHQPIAYQQSALECAVPGTVHNQNAACSTAATILREGSKDPTSAIKKLGRRFQKRIGLRECEIA